MIHIIRHIRHKLTWRERCAWVLGFLSLIAFCLILGVTACTADAHCTAMLVKWADETGVIPL